jgi:hypothetical protein
MSKSTKKHKRAVVLAAAVAGVGLWAGQASALDWDAGITGAAGGGTGTWINDGSTTNGCS